jgi:hypothetical protein
MTGEVLVSPLVLDHAVYAATWCGGYDAMLVACDDVGVARIAFGFVGIFGKVEHAIQELTRSDTQYRKCEKTGVKIVSEDGGVMLTELQELLLSSEHILEENVCGGMGLTR